MTNKYKGEVPFPQAGKGAFLRFSLDDLAEIEDIFGRDFFAVVEEACNFGSPKDVPKVLAIGLKKRGADGSAERIWDTLETDPLPFVLATAAKPILDAMSWALLGKSYDDLIKQAEEIREKEAVEETKRIAESIKQVKEAADAAGAPFEPSEALFSALLELRTGRASAPSMSGA